MVGGTTKQSVPGLEIASLRSQRHAFIKTTVKGIAFSNN